MKRPKVKDCGNISGKGAYDYVADVNKYMNYLEQQINQTTQPLEEACVNCKYYNASNYHDMMWCIDCMQKNRFKQLKYDII